MLDLRLHPLTSGLCDDRLHDGPGNLLNKAISRFNRARWAAIFEQLKCVILGRDRTLIDLEAPGDRQIGARRYGGIRAVSLSHICGTLGRSGDFDRHFHPLDDRLRDRWVSIAMARSRNIPLAPVELIQVGERYFVKDGHHRISVARARGEGAIDAEITIWERCSSQPEELPAAAGRLARAV